MKAIIRMATLGVAMLPGSASAQFLYATSLATVATEPTYTVTASSPTEDEPADPYDAAPSSASDTIWVPGSPTAAPPCTADEVLDICAPATEDAPGVQVRCSVDFAALDCDEAALLRGEAPDNPGNVITKRLIFPGGPPGAPSANGVRFDCDGGRIDAGPGTFHYDADPSKGEDVVVVASIPSDEVGADGKPVWYRPEDVTITDCHVVGGVRIKGIAWSGQTDELTESSKDADHVAYTRRNAPTRITLDDVRLEAVGRSPLYVAAGVTDSSLVNSEVTGHSDAAAVYLDAETTRITIRNNVFDVATDSADTGGFYDRGWPVIALDGSSHNQIIDNHFVDIWNGGIFLYRNCGEGGTIRHSMPIWNVIMNNVFAFAPPFWNDDAAINVGSRDYDSFHESLFTCNDDEYDGSPYGSGVSNKDFALYNAIMQNQFVADPTRGSLDDFIRSRDWSDNDPNYFAANSVVADGTALLSRPAGCFVPEFGQALLADGESREIVESDSCVGTVTCRDGEVIHELDLDCRLTEVPFECQAVGDDGGCEGVALCPAGGTVVGAKAACNLEYGRVDDAALDGLPVQRLSVVRASDEVDDGLCHLGENAVSRNQDVLHPFEGHSSGVEFGCSEHDANGGDCHIAGVAYCLPPETPPAWSTYSFWSTAWGW